MKDLKTAGKRTIQKTLDMISTQREAPVYTFIILIVLYIAASVAITRMANSHAAVTFFGTSVPLYSFAGVLSSLSQLCVIFMTAYCGKKGYFTSMALLVSQFPAILVSMLKHHSITSLSGVFAVLLSMVAITLIYLKNKREKAFQASLREQAVTDALTGLPNRFAVTALMKELIKKGEKYVAVSIDLNGFKGINDTFGFDMGNRVLTETAMRWMETADSGTTGTLDFIARTSGDEFLLIIRDYHSDEDVLNTIKQYENVLSKRLTIDECDHYITASFGYAEYPKDSDDGNFIGSYATAAMKEIKRSGSSEHILRFTPDILKNGRTLEIERKIRAALDNDMIYFKLQPQFDMEHRLRGFEALARMKDEDGTPISPGEFIPVAEKVGLIDRVDAAVFRKSAMAFGEYLRKYGADLTLSLNASVQHLMKNGFVDEVRELLESSGIPADKLEIEITESIMIDSVDKALRCISDIKDMGVKLAIDDFGTGYSSLSYLSSFPANMLKIDKSFIDKMNSNDSSKQYVAAIISMGHIMGFDVISEGVEEDYQIETLREIGCDFIQGFVWGRPLTPDKAEELVRASAV